jgi:hypothetical protein
MYSAIPNFLKHYHIFVYAYLLWLLLASTINIKPMPAVYLNSRLFCRIGLSFVRGEGVRLCATKAASMHEPAQAFIFT